MGSHAAGMGEASLRLEGSDVRGLHPTELRWLLQMRVSLPRHDLLGEERLTSRRGERCQAPLFGLLLSLACIGMHIKERRYSLQITFLGSQGSF